MATPLSLPLDRSYLVRWLRRFYRQRLTLRGRFVLWATLVLAFIGVDTRRALVFMLFALAAPPFLVALGRLVVRRPDVRFGGRLPLRLTAGRPVSAPLEIAPLSGGLSGPLALFWEGPLPDPASFSVEPVERYFDAPTDRPALVRVDLRPRRRGRYLLPRLGVAGTDLFGLVRTRAVWLDVAGRARLSALLHARGAAAADGAPLPARRHPARLRGRRLARVRRDARVPRGRRAPQDPLALVGAARQAGRAGVPGGVLLAHRAGARHLPAAQAAAARAGAARGGDLASGFGGRALQPERGDRGHPRGGPRPLRGEHGPEPRLPRQRARRARVPRAVRRRRRSRRSVRRSSSGSSG